MAVFRKGNGFFAFIRRTGGYPNFYKWRFFALLVEIFGHNTCFHENAKSA